MARLLVFSVIMYTVLLSEGILVPGAATAATYYVATTGSDANPCTQAQPCQTIAQGIRSLRSGDTLYLRGGTYTEGINTNTQPIPSGTSWSSATVIAAYPGETVILRPSSGWFVVGVGGDASVRYIILDRLILDAINVNARGSGVTAEGYALALGCCDDANHIRFQNGEIKNAWGQNVDLQGSFNEIIRSKISNSRGAYGFYISKGHDHLIDGNEIYNNAGYAIHIYSGYYTGPGQGSTDNHIVRNNRMYNNGFDLLFPAMVVSKGTNVLVYNNLIYNNFAGIAIDYSETNAQIYSNTIYNNRNAYAGISMSGSTKGTIVKNNIIYQNAVAMDDQGAGTIQSNNLTTDPKFMNAAANDFRLQSTSPAIDAGVTVSVVPTDINGLPRPQGTGYDIGAYEYQGSTTVPAPTNLKAISVAP